MKIQDRDEFDYYVCESWVKVFIKLQQEKRLSKNYQPPINVDFEIKIAEKQKQSIKKFKTPKVK